MPETTNPVEAIFLEALEKPQHEWQAFLRQRCGGDADMLQKVSELLASHEKTGSFFVDKQPAWQAPAELPDCTEKVGQRIGPYTLREKIGEGGMGVVYVAEQQRPIRRKVALKVIKPGMDSKVVVARFEAERQALALMDHPNIAKVLDAGTTQSGHPFFAMELVKGIAITEYCDQNKLTLRERLDLFIEVCRAIQHAHHKGIIHRDIKPTNVLVTLHDGVPVPKVIDFGIAKALNSVLTEQTLYTAHFQRYREELELNALDALLAGKPEAQQLIDDAEFLGTSSATLVWLRAMLNLNNDDTELAIQELESQLKSSDQVDIATQATLAFAYIEAGQLTEHLEQVAELRDRKPKSLADELMLGVALQWHAPHFPSEKLLRSAVVTRDTPITRTMCARSIAITAMLERDSVRAQEATEFISIAEIMSPNLQVVNDTSVFVHHIGMLNSDGYTHEIHRKLGLKASAFPERTVVGELIRGYFYEHLGELQLAKQAFIAAAQKGDMPAYHLAPFLFMHWPESALTEFESVALHDPDGAGALGGKALLMALTPGHQEQAIKIVDEIVARYTDFDTRLDALCAALLAGDSNACVNARNLLQSCFADLSNLDASYKYFADLSQFEDVKELALNDPSNGHTFYAAGVKSLVAGNREQAIDYFDASANCPNFMSSYPYYSKAILKRLKENDHWPAWLPNER